MTAVATRRLRAATADDTEACGRRLAAALGRAGVASGPGVVRALQLHLRGELGAGKTTLARGLIRALGVSGTIRSPTFTVLETYEVPDHLIVHLDLYRIADPRELEQLGLADFDRAGALWIIEWPQHGGARLNDCDLEAVLTAGPDAHTIDLHARSALGASWLSAF